MVPARKPKKWPTPPMDPELRAQVMRMIDAYTTGDKKMVFSMGGNDYGDDLGPALMKATLNFVKAYDNNEFSPTMQKKVIATLKKTVGQFST